MATEREKMIAGELYDAKRAHQFADVSAGQAA